MIFHPRLIFVGEGPSSALLRSDAERLAPGRVVFEGHVADPDRLSQLYAGALASVSPGPVGLSLTHSLGYGVPMIVARSEPHGPEVEAAVEGENAIFFEPETPEALEAALLEAARDVEAWVSKRALISEYCRHRYSAEAMADDGVVPETLVMLVEA